MRRIAISLIVGAAIAFGVPVLLGLVYGGTDAIVPTMLYWWWYVTDKLGLTDCASANLVSEKLSCAYRGVLIDVVIYPLAICVCSYLAHRVLFRRRRQLRASSVA